MKLISIAVGTAAGLLALWAGAPALPAQTFTKITTGPLETDTGAKLTSAWADFDQDGRLDVFIPVVGADNLLYRNLGNGTFEGFSAEPVTSSGGNSTAGLWGDYDNDGVLDLFVVNRFQDHFLYRGLGAGNFAAVSEPTILAGGAEAYFAAWVDYDNDGNLDLFLANLSTQSFFYRNNGEGSFTKNTTAAIANVSANSLATAWGDYNNDGLMDVWFANALYRNDGGGVFTVDASGPNLAGSGLLAGIWADYDNDGDLDLFVTSRNGPNFLFRNDGASGFTQITSGEIVTDEADSNGAAWGDFDNDGWLDLYVANGDVPANQANFFYRNNGNGTFTKITTGEPATDIEHSASAAWVDYDNDGDLDLFVANASGGNSLYRNDGNENNWLKVRLTGTTSNRSAIGAKVRATAQINGVTRNLLRFVSGDAGFTSQNLELHFGLGNAETIETLQVEWPSGAITTLNNVAADQTITVTESVFSLASTASGAIVTDENDSSGAVWGDVNGDGWEDLFVVNFNQQSALYLNQGDGTFNKVTGIAPVANAAGGLAAALADIDNDGDADLFVANAGADRLYRNNGDGTWTEQTGDVTQQDGLISMGAAFGDYDGDGLLDLVVATGGGGASQPNLLYRNLGGGAFEKLTTGVVAESVGFNISASWADYDGDGDLDLLFTGNNLLFRNDGAGSFTQITSTPISTVTGFPHGGAWADYDNDGDLDVLIVNGSGAAVLYRNGGDGSFAVVPVPAFAGGSAVGVAWGDYDNDGFIDVAFASRGGSQRVFRNNGSGGFALLPLQDALAAGNANGVSWVDYDHDGDLDLFFARGGDTGSMNNQINLLLNNAGNENGWLTVKLNGSVSNRDGIGAKIRVTAQINGETRQQLRQLGGNLNLAHFGLGDASIIDEVRVEWPSGQVQTLADVAANQRLTIEESITTTLTHVIPAGHESTDGNYYAGTLHESQLRLQVVYGAANFPAGPMTITELRFRRDINEPPFNSATAAATVKLSTTTGNPGSLSATFANNVGADETTVFNGNWTYSSPTASGSGVVKPFEIVLPLTTPFTYNPANGNLLFDIRITSNSSFNWTDGVSGGQHLVSRVISLNANSLTGDANELTGDVIQLVYRTAAALEILPASGTFTNSVQVSMQSSIGVGVIRYTTDGSDPEAGSTAYSGPFNLTETTTVKARLFVNGFPASEIVEATYTRYVPPDIQFNPPGQLFTNQLSVALINNVGAGVIRYTLDGSAPTSTSPAYAGPLNLTVGATVRARVFLNTFPVSEEFSETYARVYAFGDDGVPFAWREQYFGPGFLTNPCAAAGADCDDDGYSVAEEYQYATDPTDGDSAPEILLTVRAVPRLTFTTVAGRSYRIDRTTELNPPDWQTIVESVTASGTELHYVDEEAPDNSYYRIELIQD